MSQDTPAQFPHLLVKSQGEPIRVELEVDSTVLIGSGGHCKIQLVGEGVRSLHCIVSMKEERHFEVRDWNTGCTFVNGSAISDPVVLKDGDRIRVANQEIIAALPEVVSEVASTDVEAKQQQPFPVGPPTGQIKVEIVQPAEVKTEGEETLVDERVSQETVYNEPTSAVEEVGHLEDADPQPSVSLASELEVQTSVDDEDTASTEEEAQPTLNQESVVEETREAELADEARAVVDEPAIEEPVAEEPVAEEPVVDESPQEERFAEETEAVEETVEESSVDEELKKGPMDLFDSIEDELSEEESQNVLFSKPENESTAAASEYVYDVDADLEEDSSGCGYEQSAYTSSFASDEEFQSLRMENEQLRFELSQEPVVNDNSDEFLDREQTVHMVARLEELLAELTRSDERTRDLEDLLRHADQATQDEREERMLLQSLLAELEERVELRESKADAEVAELKQKLEEARKTQQQSNESLQGLMQAKTNDVQGVPKEIVIELKNQVELLLEQLKTSQKEVASLRAELEEENREPSSSEIAKMEDLKQKLMALQVELKREKAEFSRERAELQRLKVASETRNQADKSQESTDELGSRITSLMERVSAE